MKRKSVFLLYLFCFGVFSMGFFSCAQEDVVSSAEQEVIYAVNASRVVESNLDDYLQFGGDVSAKSSIDIIPDTSGKLARLLVEVGDVVKKDQVVAEIDPSRPGMTYSFSPVKAPVSGTVTSLPVPVGTTVAPSLSLGKVSSISDLEITISVAERYISRVALNQKAYVNFDAYPGEVFMAKVTKVSPVLDTLTRTMNVTLEFESTDKRIKAGMYANVKLITEEKQDVSVIPVTALVSRNGEDFVYTVKENESGKNYVEKRLVQPGIKVDGIMEIKGGLSLGEIVVTKGQTLLNEGDLVNVVSLQDGE